MPLTEAQRLRRDKARELRTQQISQKRLRELGIELAVQVRDGHNRTRILATARELLRVSGGGAIDPNTLGIIERIGL